MENTWYPFLVKKGDENRNALFILEKYRPNIDFVICKDDGKYKSFSKFSSYSHLLNFINKLDEKDRCFFEIVTENTRQKLYFDIDIKLADEELDSKKYFDSGVLNFAANIEKIFLPLFVKSNVYTSYNPETPNKLSYHIIVDGAYFNTYSENKNAAIYILKNSKGKIANQILESVDMGVYKSLQQFRILHCQKYGSGRIKTQMNDYVPILGESETRDRNVAQFASSLITEISSCIQIPKTHIILTLNLSPIKAVAPKFRESVKNSEVDIVEIYEIMKDKFLKQDLEFPFEIRDDVYNNDQNSLIIPLSRKRPSFCTSCVRNHENENPYISFNNSTNTAYFVCRRSGPNSKFQSVKIAPKIKEKENSPLKPLSVRFKNYFGCWNK